jgi:chromate transporter
VVGYMQRDLVEQLGWIGKEDFLNGVALGQTMPGPLAAQVAMWVGYLRRGALGAVATAAAFIVPSFLMVTAVAVLYVHYSGLRMVQSLFYGIAPAVMVIIAIAAFKLVRLTDGTGRRAWAISGVVFAVTAATGQEPIYLIIGAGLLMIMLDARPALRPPRRQPPSPGTGEAPPGPRRRAAGLGGARHGGRQRGAGLTGAVFPQDRRPGLRLRAGHRAAAARRSGRPAPLAHPGPVPRRGRHGLITPGPVVITAAFIGYLVAGLPGAVIDTVAIFTPIWLGVVVPGRWFVQHRDNAQVKAFVTGATAAAGGALSGAVVVLTRQAVTDLPTIAIALVTLGVLLRFKIGEPWIVAAAGRPARPGPARQRMPAATTA